MRYTHVHNANPASLQAARLHANGMQSDIRNQGGDCKTTMHCPDGSRQAIMPTHVAKECIGLHVNLTHVFEWCPRQACPMAHMLWGGHIDMLLMPTYCQRLGSWETLQARLQNCEYMFVFQCMCLFM
jgi:hypothetical protein